MSVSPAQGQDERPPLGVEGVLELLLFRAGRTRRVVGSRMRLKKSVSVELRNTQLDCLQA